MANDYYGRDRDFIPFTRARGDDVQFELDAIKGGFDKLPTPKQLASGQPGFVALGGTNTLTASMTPAWTAYTGKDGYLIVGRAANTSTGAVTINVNGLGAQSVVRNDGKALAAGDLQAAGLYQLVFNESASKFFVANYVQSQLDEAEAAALEAEHWADYPENSLVPEGDGTQYSSFHHSRKSAASASASSSSASAASTSETNAATSETNAAGSASAASTSETNAATSATNAAGSETKSKDWAEKAEDIEVETGAYSSKHHKIKSAASASAAATSEANAATSETNAAGSASAAATSETNAAGSASSASTSASNAATSETNAANTWNTIRGAYYGALSDDPLQDPLGNPPAAGDRYYNTTEGVEKSYSGSAWVTNEVGSLEARFVAVTATAFVKDDGTQPAWTAPTASTLTTSSALALVVGSTVVEIASGTSVTLPTLAAGKDYTIYASTAGALQAVDADSAAPAGERVVGGFHASAGGSSIVESSLWDLNWRPKSNPRAMVLDPGGTVWADIYLCDVDYALNGYSRNGQQIADGNSLPKIPTEYGGDGTATYSSGSWWSFNDIFSAAGKRFPYYQEFTALAYGVVERQAVGTDPGTTQHQAGHRSACGVEQATGVMNQWGADLGATAGSAWQNIADGRGDIYASNLKAPLFGAYWGVGTNAGSRASNWANAPDNSFSSGGARAVSDHLNLQAER